MSINHHDFRAAVEFAILAPSLHNSQPWRFALAGDEVLIFGDLSRTPPIADPDGWAVRIACGAAAYNLELAFAASGTPMAVHWQAAGDERNLLATLRPTSPGTLTPRQQRLFAAIPHRHSNRRPFRAEPVPGPARAAMVEAAAGEGAWLELVVGPIAAAAVSEIAHAANRVLQRNAAYVAELASWTSPDAPGADGVPADAGGFSAGPQDLLPHRPFSDLVRMATTDPQEQPLIAVLGTNGDSPRDHLQAGYALQRVLLTITDHGLASSMLSQPIEVPAAREQLRIALGRHGKPQMVLRVGYGEPVSATPRRPVADVIDLLVPG